MKKLYSFYPLLFTASLVLLSFFTINSTKAQGNSYVKKPITTAGSAFVEMNDGTIRNFSSLKMVTGIMMTPHLVADGHLIINGNEIKSYQDDAQHFAVSQKVFESGRRTHLAVDVLPGFVQRIAAGKLSIYNKQSFNGFRRVDEFFIQLASGAILPYSESLMNDLVKDEPQALKLFNCKNKNQSLLEKLQLTANIVNAGGLVSKN